MIHGETRGQNVVDLGRRAPEMLRQFVPPKVDLRLLAHELLDKMLDVIAELRHKNRLHLTIFDFIIGEQSMNVMAVTPKSAKGGAIRRAARKLLNMEDYSAAVSSATA